MRRMVKNNLDQEVPEALTTVLENFPAPQRQATKKAGQIEGLKLKRIVNNRSVEVLESVLIRLTKI